MGLYLGIDGGGTKTVGVLADGREIALRRVEVGPTNPHALPLETLEQHLRELLERLAVPLSEVDAVGVGLAGLGRADDRQRILPILERLGLDPRRLFLTHDAHIALVGGVGEDVGVILIAGTGSIAYGRTPSGEELRCGGWGSLLGDEGSGYALGLNALREIARRADGREKPTALTEAVLSSLHRESPQELIWWAHTAEKAQIADLAPLVFRCASEGDEAARRLLRDGAVQLAELATTVLRKGAWERTPTLVLSGGLFERFRAYRDRVARLVFDAYPNVRICTPERPSVFGAIRLARWMKEGRP